MQNYRNRSSIQKNAAECYRTGKPEVDEYDFRMAVSDMREYKKTRVRFPGFHSAYYAIISCLLPPEFHN